MGTISHWSPRLQQSQRLSVRCVACETGRAVSSARWHIAPAISATGADLWLLSCNFLGRIRYQPRRARPPHSPSPDISSPHCPAAICPPALWLPQLTREIRAPSPTCDQRLLKGRHQIAISSVVSHHQGDRDHNRRSGPACRRCRRRGGRCNAEQEGRFYACGASKYRKRRTNGSRNRTKFQRGISPNQWCPISYKF